MRILILDDQLYKCEWIKCILNENEIENEQITYLEGALEKIKNKYYDGIILDMQFPILKNNPISKDAGLTLLKIMRNKNVQIPVLGNSTVSFSNIQTYPFFKGKLSGFRTYDNERQLLEFIRSIEKQSD